MPSATLGRRAALFLATFVAIWSFAAPSVAAGVSVAPSRIVLEGRTLAATVYVTNRSDKTNTYRISLARMRMLDDGIVVRVDENDVGGEELFANELIRFSPRRCVIPPGGSQTIRLLVRRPRGAMPQQAEYRSHLVIRTVPDVPLLAEIENKESGDDSDALSVRAVASVGSFIPIIIRFGRLEATTGVENIRLDDTSEPMVTFDLLREGTRSLYGDVHIIHVTDRDRRNELGLIRGLAVYTPLLRRQVEHELQVPEGYDLTGGRIEVIFEETPEGGGDATASGSLPLASPARR